MLVNIPLDGTYNTRRMKERVNQPHRDVDDFLKAYPTAKIVVVIDTHCFQENGLFVWSDKGSSRDNGCLLWAVGLMNCAIYCIQFLCIAYSS